MSSSFPHARITPIAALEAHICGIPVVAITTLGLPDIVEDLVTRALEELFDPASLSACISLVIKDEQPRSALV